MNVRNFFSSFISNRNRILGNVATIPSIAHKGYAIKAPSSTRNESVLNAFTNIPFRANSKSWLVGIWVFDANTVIATLKWSS